MGTRLYRVVKVTRIGRSAVSDQLDMERVARKHQILEEEELLGNYVNRRQVWLYKLNEILRIQASKGINQAVDTMLATEKSVYLALVRKEGPPGEPYVHATFQRLTEASDEMLSLAEKVVDQEVARLEAKTKRTSQSVVLKALWVIPVTFILVLFFTFLIVRPIRQLAGEIRRLGDGFLDSPVRVGGTADLEYVGEQLDWLRNRLRYVESEKVRFMRSVTHDLKTPLASLREGSELLVGGDLEPPLHEDHLEVAQIMLDASIRLQRLIDDLFDYHKAQEINILRAVTKVSVDALAKQVIADHMLALRNKQLKLETEISAVSIFGDQEKIRAVIDNLVSNAVKYTPVGGWIKVKLEKWAGRAVLDVIDSGPGIAVEDRKRIFDVYYRGRERAKTYTDSTGVGLSMVRDYVSIHQGTVELLDSERGAHFRVSLPMRVEVA